MIRGRIVAPGQLSLNFFLGLSIADAPYNVLYIDKDYNYALVASCSVVGGSLVWIISRTPTLDQEIYMKLYHKALDMGFRLDDFENTVQKGCWVGNGQIMKHPNRDYNGQIPQICVLPNHIHGNWIY